MAITRVTQQMLTDSSLYSINSNLSKMQEVQNVLDTGKKINKPSDDPTGTTTALRARAALADQAQFQRNISDGTAWLQTVDSSLGTVSDNLNRLTVLATQASNTGSYGQTSLSAIADEVDQIKQALVSVSNTSYLGRPVFGGTVTTPTAFNADGTYVGNGQPVWRRVGTDEVVAVNSDGSSVFGQGLALTPPGTTVDSVTNGTSVATADGGTMSKDANGNVTWTAGPGTPATPGPPATPAVPAGQLSFFQQLDNFSSALQTGNQAGITQGLQDVQAQGIRLSNAESDEGARMNRIQAAGNVSQDQSLSLESVRSGAEDADLAKSVITLQSQQVAYQAALAATAKTIQPSLIQFLN